MEIPYNVSLREDTGLYNAKLGIWLFLASEIPAEANGRSWSRTKPTFFDLQWRKRIMFFINN